MRWKAALLFLAVVAAGCSDTDDGAPPSTTETAPTQHDDDGAAEEAEEQRLAAISAWADRPLADILDEGFDTEPCVHEPNDGDAATVTGLGWAFLPLPLQIVDLERTSGEIRPAVVLEADEVFPHANGNYRPTHAWIRELDVPMLAQLSDEVSGESEAEVLLGISPTDQGRAGLEPERMAFASLAWILTDDQVIPFNGECGRITTFKLEVGDPVNELAILRTDPYRRAEVAGLTDDELDFSDCRNEEVGLGKGIGFGGDDVGFAFGPWPTDADAFFDISLEGWTIIPPAGEEAPTFIVRGDDGFPRGAGLDPNGWLLTFTVIEDRAEVHALFSIDAVLGLRIWAPSPFSDGQGPCFEARQVISFQEFLDDEIPDRPAWDLSPALPGGEQAVMETLEFLMTDASAHAAFHEWTPCTYKLCELNEEVVR